MSSLHVDAIHLIFASTIGHISAWIFNSGKHERIKQRYVTCFNIHTLGPADTNHTAPAEGDVGICGALRPFSRDGALGNEKGGVYAKFEPVGPHVAPAPHGRNSVPSRGDGVRVRVSFLAE